MLQIISKLVAFRQRPRLHRRINLKVNNDHRCKFPIIFQFTAMIIIHFHLPPQFTYELFHGSV